MLWFFEDAPERCIDHRPIARDPFPRELGLVASLIERDRRADQHRPGRQGAVLTYQAGRRVDRIDPRGECLAIRAQLERESEGSRELRPERRSSLEEANL